VISVMLTNRFFSSVCMRGDMDGEGDFWAFCICQEVSSVEAGRKEAIKIVLYRQILSETEEFPSQGN